MYCCPRTSPSTSTTSGTLMNCAPSLKVDWSKEEEASKRTGNQCSSQQWTRWTTIKIWKKFKYDLDKPRMVSVTHILGELTKNTVYWCNVKLAQRKGLQFYQTRSHAIALFNALPAIIEKVIYMKTGEELYCKVFQSPRLSRVVLTPNSQHGRQDPPNPDERKSTDHECEQRLSRETWRSLLEDTWASRRKSAMDVQGSLSR